MKPNVEINIKELILQGFSPKDAYRIGQSLELELGRLIQEKGLPKSLSQEFRIDVLDGGQLRAPLRGDANTIGTGIANSVYRSLAQPVEPQYPRKP